MSKINVGKPYLLKEINRSSILDTIKSKGQMSRADIARELKLSKPTVSKAVNSLLKEGLLKEAGFDKSSGGKRGMLLDFNSEGGLIAGVYVGASGIIFALSDLNANIIKRNYCSLVNGKDATSFIVTQVQKLCSELDGHLKLKGIGVAIAALTDASRGVVKASRYLPGWEGLEIQKMLEEAFQVPVVVDNDVVMAVLGEHSHGIARGFDDVVMFTFGHALALGIIINGQIHRGRHYAAGEIGDMVIDKNMYAKKPNGMGGYLERHAGWGILRKKSLHLLAEEICNPGNTGVEVTVDDTVNELENELISELDTQYKNKNGTADRASDDTILQKAFDRANKDRRFAEKLLKQNWIDTGLAIANIVSVIDPSLVVLGGEINNAPKMYVDNIKKVIRSVVRFAPDIRKSSLGRDAELLGSITMAIDRLQSKVTVSREYL